MDKVKSAAQNFEEDSQQQLPFDNASLFLTFEGLQASMLLKGLKEFGADRFILNGITKMIDPLKATGYLKPWEATELLPNELLARDYLIVHPLLPLVLERNQDIG
jgi:hypothetical protein